MARPKNVDATLRTAQMYHQLIKTFRAKGYEGAALSDLSAATGLAKASFYHRFPGGKPELGRATLAEAGKRFADTVLRPLQSKVPADKRWSAMLDGVALFYADGANACLMNSMTIGDGAALFGKDIRLTLNAWEKLISAVFEESGTAAIVARQQAEDVIIRIEGALVVARMKDKPEVLAMTLEALRQWLMRDKASV